jgi:hypothetical protein
MASLRHTAVCKAVGLWAGSSTDFMLHVLDFNSRVHETEVLEGFVFLFIYLFIYLHYFTR